MPRRRDAVAATISFTRRRDAFAEAYGQRFQWRDFGTDLGEFLSARIVQTPETPLSERGREQARRVGERLAVEGLGVVRELGGRRAQNAQREHQFGVGAQRAERTSWWGKECARDSASSALSLPHP